MISLKPESNPEEGLRIAFNYLRRSDLCKLENGYKHIEKKIEYENMLRNWFLNNLDGLPVIEEKKGSKI